MKIKNKIEGCEKAIDFILSEISNYNTTDLTVTLLNVNCDVHKGYCEYPVQKRKGLDYRITAGINPNLNYCVRVRYFIGTKQWTGATKGFSWIEQDTNLKDCNENLIWIFFHELWHFLCHSKQKKGNYQTKANVFGFDMLEKYRNYYE